MATCILYICIKPCAYFKALSHPLFHWSLIKILETDTVMSVKNEITSQWTFLEIEISFILSFSCKQHNLKEDRSQELDSYRKWI